MSWRFLDAFTRTLTRSARRGARPRLTRAILGPVISSSILPNLTRFVQPAFAESESSSTSKCTLKIKSGLERRLPGFANRLQVATDPPLAAFQPHPAIGSYVLAACRPGDDRPGNVPTLRLAGQAHTFARGFGWDEELFGGHVRGNTDVEIGGQADVNGDAASGPERGVEIKGSAHVAGATNPAAEPLGCGADDLGALTTWVQENHYHAAIGDTDRDRLPWGKPRPLRPALVRTPRFPPPEYSGNAGPAIQQAD